MRRVLPLLVALALLVGCGEGISEQEAQEREEAAREEGQQAEREAAQDRVTSAYQRGEEAGFAAGGDSVTASFKNWQAGETYIVTVRRGRKGADWRIDSRIPMDPFSWYKCPIDKDFCSERAGFGAPPITIGDGAIDDDEPCHPSYKGNCLDPNAIDYDCIDGGGDGPFFTGPVSVVGPDPYDLDRDSNGLACEDF